MKGYFTHNDLTHFKKTEGKKLSSVFYHYWQNKANPADLFEFVDKLELRFSDGSGFVLSSASEEENAIQLLPDFDPERERLLLLKDFGGKLDIRTEEVSTHSCWKSVIGIVLREVQLVDDGENTYRNDAVLLDFGKEKIEVRPNVEGLIIEPFEDV